MSAPSREALRRGFCPSTLSPMETGDGWLVRLHPPGGALTPAQLRRIATLAGETGNGLIEITARGNLQLRGIRPEAHAALVVALLSEGLVDEHGGDGPQRLAPTSPLAGVDVGDLIDAVALAEAIEMRGRTISGLPTKFAVVVDGGGAVALDAFADLRVRAVAADAVLIGMPRDIWLGPVDIASAAETVAGLLARFAALHRAAPSAIRRMRDLSPAARAERAAATGLPEAAAPASRAAPARVGLFALADEHFAAIVGLPFGRTDTATLDQLAAAAERFGAADIRLSPWRGIAFRGMTRPSAEALLSEAATLGLITRDDDPRLLVQACAGKPACGRGETKAMADAAVLAEGVAPLLAAGLGLHVSGCIKSCAHPGRADLTLVGESGRYGVVIGGGARDEPIARLDLAEIMARLQPGQDLYARLMARRSGPRP